MSETMYAPQVARYQGQKFVVAIEADTLTLAVVNQDGSYKKLSVSATITAAAPLSPAMRDLLNQPRYECKIGSDIITINRRREGQPSSAKEEKQWLLNTVASKLLDSGLLSLFPGNRHVQYAE